MLNHTLSFWTFLNNSGGIILLFQPPNIHHNMLNPIYLLIPGEYVYVYVAY